MNHFDSHEDIVESIFLGHVIKVERFGSPVQVITLTYSDGRRVNVTAIDGDLVFGEDNLPEC